MKRCSKCKEVKDKSLFYRDKTHKDGLSSWCKNCHSAFKKYYGATLEKKIEISLKKLDYIEFQSIYGANTCICKECGEIKSRYGYIDKKSPKGISYLWVCRDCFNKNKNIKTRDARVKSKYKGVRGQGNKYTCRISQKHKYIYLGAYDTEIEAAKAYNQYVVENNLDRPLNIIGSEKL